MNTCRVTIWNPHVSYRQFRASTHRCGLPVTRRGLCEQHYADRLRLGGAA